MLHSVHSATPSIHRIGGSKAFSKTCQGKKAAALDMARNGTCLQDVYVPHCDVCC